MKHFRKVPTQSGVAISRKCCFPHGYAIYAHDEHDRDELLRQREAFSNIAFNPDCAQCQANPTRQELLRTDERLRQIEARNEPRAVARRRKDEGETCIPVITEQIQQAIGLRDAEARDWSARHAAYRSKLHDAQRLAEQRCVCAELQRSLQQTLDDWQQSDVRACYQRHKRAVLTHSETTERLAHHVDARGQIAVFIKNEHTRSHNAAIHARMASLTAQLQAPDDDDEIDIAYAEYVAQSAQLESITCEHERVVHNNTVHRTQQAHCAQLQHELDELRRAWRSSESKSRYVAYKRAQTSYTETLQALHRLEEKRELHRIHTHNESVHAHNLQVQMHIGVCRQAMHERAQMTYDEYDANVAIRAHIHPKREALVRIDAQCVQLERELASLGASSDEVAMDEAEVARMQQSCDAEQAMHDALHAKCASLRAELAAFLAQRQKSVQRNAKIDVLEREIRALELSIEMLSERGVVACWFERALTMIQTAVNAFASTLLGRSLSFTCVGDKIEIGFASTANETAIPIFGGMESVVVDLAIQMALAELTRSVRCDLLIIDEAFFAMDQHNRMQLEVPRLLHELQQKYNHVFVISHDVIHQEIQITSHDQHKKIHITGVCT
jgi:hypothetical protein